MASALRLGASRVKDAWGDEGSHDPTGPTAEGMEEYGVAPGGTPEDIIRNIPEWALRVEPEDVVMLAEQTCLKPSSIAERFNHLLSRYCSKQRERIARKELEKAPAETKPSGPSRDGSKRSGAPNRPPIKALPQPALPGTPGVQVIQVAGTDTAIPVYTS